MLGDPVSRSRYDRDRLRDSSERSRIPLPFGVPGATIPGTGSTPGLTLIPTMARRRPTESHGPQQRSSTRDTSSPAVLSALGRVLWTLAIVVMLAIEILSVPAIMMGFGGVLFVAGALAIATIAMNYILMVLLGAPCRGPRIGDYQEKRR